LRKAAATAMARRTRRAPGAAPKPRRMSLAPFLMVGVAVVTVAGLLLVALPTKQVAGEQLPSFAPLAPQADALATQDAVSLDGPFQVQFTKPMNEASVQAALTIDPKVAVVLQWDATSQVLSIAPASHWEPSTNYTVDISNAATDQEGLSLATPVHTVFTSGALTSGTISGTLVVGDQAAPNSAFQVTFDRPVKLSTVITRFAISPQVDVTIAGDDPTDAASQVFTMTPKKPLDPQANYTLTFADGGTDSSGSALQPVASYAVTTMETPEVVRFRPQDGTVAYDTNQPVSVRFTTEMDTKATAAAFSVTVGGRAVAGSLYWAEGNTVLVLTPRYSFKIGSVVVASVSTAARSVTGIHISKAASSTFKIAKPTVRNIPYSFGGVTSASAPYYSSEVYYLGLMNCTRTGGWVTRSGTCSSETHHTLPAQGNLVLDASISNKVSRPYAAYMATTRQLDHYLRGTTPHSRLAAQGYGGGSWGENIASPSTPGRGGMIDIEIFYQNEYWCRCEHYANIMSPYYRRAGIGVAVVNGVTRVSIDFYN
jgi:hypothetical protein